MEIKVYTKSGQIFRGEFQTKMSSLLWINIPEKDLDKQALGELLGSEIEGLYSLKEKDGGLEICLQNSGVEKVEVL